MKRYIEFDIARTITLLLLPLCHTTSMLFYFNMGSEQVLAPFGGIMVIAPLGVAIFMICMGVNLCLSKNGSPRNCVRRALVLFGFGLVLNLLRYLLPGAAAWLLYRDGELIHLAIRSAVASDILYFAALCFLLFAWMKKCGITPLRALAIACGMSLLDMLLPNPALSGTLLGDLLGNFIYIDRFSSFAFLQWAVFPAFGIVFGKALLRAEQVGDTARFWRRAAMISAGVLCVQILLCPVLGIDLASVSGSQYDTYNMELPGAVAQTCAAVLSLCLAKVLARGVKDTSAEGLFVRFSQSITRYYVCQWVLVMWSVSALFALGCGEDFLLSTTQIVLLCVAVTVGAVLLSQWGGKRKSNI